MGVALILGCGGHGAREPKPSTCRTIARSGSADGEERSADLGACVLESGERIEGCHIGFRTYGTLNATRDNAVLFLTWFTGTTRSLSPIVPDKIVDTKRFYLVLVDAIGNGVSSSPSNSCAQPRRRFPKFSIRDMVESQRRLIREVLGIPQLHAVMGISMGGMQAFEWAVHHASEVSRFVSIVGTPQLAAQDLLLWNAERDVLDDSRAYARGAYEGRPKIAGLQEVHWLNLSTPEHRNSETTRAGFESFRKNVAEDTEFDWNDWRAQLEAMLAHDVARESSGDLANAAKGVTAQGLVVVAEHDHMVNPEPAKAFARAMGAELISLDTPCGHMAPACDETLAPRVRRFLER